MKRLLRSWRLWLTGAGLTCLAVLANFCFTQRAVPLTAGVDSPMLSAVLVTLGGCRGIISEVLWWRIAELQKENRYAELMPLTDLLVSLDPASADTWVYNAWNLSYNISAAHHDAAEKWYWVKEGITLLERGLRASPRAEPILRQLGWTFEDKLGRSADSAASYYRAHLTEIPVPADAETFATATGVVPNWNAPEVRALYWYWRANHGRDMLRVTLDLVYRLQQTQWVPFLLQVVRHAWDDLAPPQQEQVRYMLLSIPQTHPSRHAVETFLKEVTP